jgi:hypothetical protein
MQKAQSLQGPVANQMSIMNQTATAAFNTKQQQMAQQQLVFFEKRNRSRAGQPTST